MENNSYSDPVRAPFPPETDEEIFPDLPFTPDSETAERYPNRFKPGQSGNPSGRPKRTKEEKDGLEEIRKLAPGVADRMVALLDSPKVPAIAKVRILEIILERTYGKPESSIKLVSAQQSVEAARARIAAVVSAIRIKDDE